MNNGHLPASPTWAQRAAALGTDTSGEVDRFISRVEDGSIREFPSPWPMLMGSTKCLIPGTITVLCGDPGTSKSLMALQLFGFIHRAGIPVAMYALEGNRAFYGRRALAQISGESGLTDIDWIRLNPEKAREITDKHRDWLALFGQAVTTSPHEQVDYAKILRWIDANAEQGVRVFCVDPVTAAAPDTAPWAADRAFVNELGKRMSKHGACVVVVTHPKKGVKGGAAIDDLASGAAWGRFTDSVLWLTTLKDEQGFHTRDREGERYVRANRMVTALKARNGRYNGGRFAMWFSRQGLTTQELGMVVKDD